MKQLKTYLKKQFKDVTLKGAYVWVKELVVFYILLNVATGVSFWASNEQIINFFNRLNLREYFMNMQFVTP